jgi:hypothetical protein
VSAYNFRGIRLTQAEFSKTWTAAERTAWRAEKMTGLDQANPDEKEPTMSETEITSFTPSELMHSLALKWIDDPDNYTPEQYLQAYEIAKLEHRDIHAQADPTAAQVERTRILRKLELEGRAEESS